MNHSIVDEQGAGPEIYRDLPPHDELLSLSLAGACSNDRFNVNSHIHLPPNFSAFETVAQAVRLADEQNVRVLGASNYYDYTVYAELAAQCEIYGIMPLFGTEIICLIDELRSAGIKINDPGNPGKMYLCGKGINRFSPMNEKAAGLLETIRSNDSRRIAQMMDRLSEQFELAGIDIRLDESAVKAMVVARHGSPVGAVYLQERHVAQAFQELLFRTRSIDARGEFLTRLFGSPPKCSVDDAVGVQNKVRSNMMKAGKTAFVPETFVGFDHAYRLILALGGIPCYPTLADGASPICGYEEDVDALIAATLARDIYCCELIPVRNSPQQVVQYVTSMRQAGLIVTAGTEHNTRDVIPMNPTCANSVPIPKEITEIFWEGACVVAAHQYLTSIGRPGYVDCDGQLAGNYRSAEDRIRSLREIGSAIIHEVLGPNP